MGFLSTAAAVARDGRVILAALALASGMVVVTVHVMLEQIRDDSEIKATRPKTQYITQDTEDSLQPSTLDTLLGGYNFAIREVAAKIVCDRAVNDGATIETLLRGIIQDNYDERMKNLRCLAIITDNNTLHLLHNWKAYAALVRSLELCLADVERQKLDDEYFDEYYLRDMAEKLCLMFISQLVQRFDAEKLIKARFVEKWLAKQYWGDTEEETLRNFAMYQQHQNRITEIISHIRASPAGRAALVASKLVSKDMHAARHDGDDACSHSLVIKIGVSYEDGTVVGVGDVSAAEHSLLRVLDQTPEEQRLRHRHRDAMVYNDGSHPLTRGDIIERDPMSPP